MSDYSGWSTFEKVKIVYQTSSSKIPYAYIADAKSKKSLDDAIFDAGLHHTIVETTNDDFTFSLYKPSNNSTWICLIKKEGIPDFLVRISTDILMDVIKESTLIKGVCSEKVLFIRNNKHIGILHKGMVEYNNILNDMAIKAEIKAKKAKELKELKKNIKTSEWKIGYSYKTPSKCSTLYGYFPDLFKVSHRYIADWSEYYIDLTPDKPKMPIIASCSIDYVVETILNYNRGFSPTPIFYKSTTLPARYENKKEYDEDEIITIMTNNIRKFFHDDFKNILAVYLTNYIYIACLFYIVRPEFTNEILNLLKSYVEEDIEHIKNNEPPCRFSGLTAEGYYEDEYNKHIKYEYDIRGKKIRNHADLINFFIDYVDSL